MLYNNEMNDGKCNCNIKLLCIQHVASAQGINF